MEDKILPKIEVNEGIEFKKNIKKLRKKYRSVKEDIKPLIQQLESGETPGSRISGNKYPVYKSRVKNSDNKKGQSGGYRVIYYIVTPETILLIAIYSKSEKSDISNREIEDLIDREEIAFERQERAFVTIDPEDIEPREDGED
jgi:mRNA-degrading endonuclease RelE of RelBE toxin-antitoxin system